jgi:uncharacterized protein (TIGR03437 family)
MHGTLGLLALLSMAGVAFAQRPAISATDGILDAGSYTASIAQGGIFVVKGTALCAAGNVQAPTPLPITLNGASIAFTPVAGGTAIPAYMVYTYNLSGVTQLAALLPSTVALGDYNVTVTNGTAGTSPAVRTTVVARKLGLITVNGSGSGRAVVQNFIPPARLDLNRFTTGTLLNSPITISPAYPGQVLIAWGTGLGAVPVADNTAPGAQDLRTAANVTAIVGGTEIAPAYAGRAPTLPGTDQIQFQLPANIRLGCAVPFQVRYGNGLLSNATTIAIAPAGSTTCTSSQFTAATLARLDQGGLLVAGYFALSSETANLTLPGLGAVNAKVESLSGSFSRFTADQLNDAGGVLSTVGACTVYRRKGTQTTLLLGTPVTNLDAGSQLLLNGPNVTNQAAARASDNTYSLNLGVSVTGLVATPGTYILSGNGGADVMVFTAKVNVPSALTVTSTIPDVVPRSQPLTVNWTGGGTDLVTVSGVSGSQTGGTALNPIYDASVFTCVTTADQGTFTVPASVLSQLPVTPVTSTGMGALVVNATTQPSAYSGQFTAPLTGGIGGTIDSGVFVTSVGILKDVDFQ